MPQHSPEVSFDLLLQQGLTAAQIEEALIRGDFTLSDDDMTRLGRFFLGEQRGLAEANRTPAPGSAEANALIDSSAAQLRTSIFESGKPTEEIVTAQAQLRKETSLLKGEVDNDPGLASRIFGALSTGTDIGDTGFKVNIPLLAVGLGLLTGGLAAGGLAGVGTAIAGTGARVAGLGAAGSVVARGVGKIPLVSKIPSVVRAHPVATGAATFGATIGTGLVLSDQDSPDTITPPTPTTELDVAASIAAIQQAVPSATEPTGPQFGGTGIPEIDQFLPRFEEVETPFGRAVVTMQPQVIGGQVVGFESVDVRFPDRDAQREEREIAEFESEQQQGQITRIQEQLKIANFLADPGNRLRLQATQSLTAGTGPDVLGAQEAGLGPQVNQPNQIFGRQSGQLGALLGLDPSANIPLGSADNQPFGATPSFSALQNLNPDQLSELDALAQVGFGSDLATLERAAQKKRLPGGGRRPVATFGR